jgi:hypothetical protein
MNKQPQYIAVNVGKKKKAVALKANQMAVDKEQDYWPNSLK